MSKNKKRDLELPDEEVLKNLGKNYEVNYDIAINEIYNLPRILLNKARKNILDGEYLKAKTILDDFELLERIIIQEDMPYNENGKLRQDYENLKSIRRQLKNKYGPTRHDNSKEIGKRPYEDRGQ